MALVRLHGRLESGTERVDDRLLFRGKSQEFETVYKTPLVANNGPNGQQGRAGGELELDGHDFARRNLAVENRAESALADVVAAALDHHVSVLAEGGGFQGKVGVVPGMTAAPAFLPEAPNFL